jgi:hypothetical protein
MAGAGKAARAVFRRRRWRATMPAAMPPEGETMQPDPAEPTIEAIRRWSGVDCPNAAARHGLSDFTALTAEFEALGPTLAFEDEPSSFEAALQAEKDAAA